MNPVRVAALLRELADAFEEGEVPAPSKSEPRRERRPRAIVRPSGEAPPAVAGQAARILRDKGFR